MRPKNRILVLVLLMTVATTSQVLAAEKTMTKEYTFHSDTPDFHYAADKEIEEDGRSYHLENIDYQVLETKELYVSKQVSYKNLIKRKVPDTKTFQIEGKHITLYVDKANITYRERMLTASVHRSDVPNAPSFPEQKSLTVKGKTCKAKLVGVQEMKKNKPFVVKVKFFGAPEASFYFNGKKIQLDQDNPTWSGYEEAVKNHLNLDAESRLNGSTWTSEWQKEKGRSVRYARFTGTRPASDYIATYAYKMYDAMVTYDNKREPGEQEYTVKAVCTYAKKGFSLLQKVLCVGAGIALIALLTVLSLYVIARKRKKEIT